MVGIVVDTTIIKLLVKKFIPEVSVRIEEKDDFLGDFIGNNFINRGLINLFSNGMIDKELSLLIWDYLFIEGNKVLIKTFLAIYYFLSDAILKGEKSLEYYNEVTKLELKKIDLNNDEFIYNLFFRNDETISNLDLNDYRYNLSLQVADSLEENNIEHVKSKVKLSYSNILYDKQVDKTLTCNKNWPYCINDTYFENVTRIVFFTVFHETNKNYIQNYFFSDKKDLEEEDKKNNTKNYYTIRVERRPHYCSHIQNEIQPKNENDNIKREEENICEQINENNYEKSEKIHRLSKKVLTQKNYVSVAKVIEEKIDMHINNINNENK